jgi:predicted ATPase
MLRDLLVDNFRCLVNFELNLDTQSLLLGRSGSGKTTALDALRRLRDFCIGTTDVEAAFPRESITRWDARLVQSFCIRVETNNGMFEYRIEVEHDKVGRQSRVLLERLALDGVLLFEFLKGDVHLFRDDGSAGPVFPADWKRSSLASVPPRPDNAKLTSFKQWIDRLWVIAPDPKRMAGVSREEARVPSHDLSNLASWYRHALQEDVAWAPELFASLASVLDGFDALSLKAAGSDVRILTVSRRADAEGSAREYALDELSDGERALIALYTALHVGIRKGATLCIDEPENYVALPELQPWLFALRDRLDATTGQVIVVSHSPEIINYLASENGRVFERPNGGPARVRRWVNMPGLSPSETFARARD